MATRRKAEQLNIQQLRPDSLTRRAHALNCSGTGEVEKTRRRPAEKEGKKMH